MDKINKQLVGVATACAVLFGVVAGLMATGATYSFDTAFLHGLHALYAPALDVVAPVATYMAEPVMMCSIVAVIGVVFAYRRKWLAAVLLLCGVVGANAVGYIVKHIFARARPELWERLVTETGYSFPSGHATASMALALCIVVLLWNTKWRWWSVGLAGVYVLVIGFTRLYLGVHYPSDILAGWLLAGMWVVVVTVLARHARITKVLT